jgi:hypothetical protein
MENIGFSQYNRNTIRRLTREMTHVIFFTNTETLEAKVKPEGTPTESGER